MGELFKVLLGFAGRFSQQVPQALLEREATTFGLAAQPLDNISVKLPDQDLCQWFLAAISHDSGAEPTAG